MFELLGVPPQALFGQLMLGLINGAFYAMLSLGLAVIFGLLNIINFAHGALYMMGAFVAWFLLQYLGLGYWWAFILSPIAVGLLGALLERLLLKRIYGLDHLYGLLLTFGLALIIQGLFQNEFGSSGQPYAVPQALQGGHNLGSCFCPPIGLGGRRLAHRLPRHLVCHRAHQARLLSPSRNRDPALVQAFGINVPRLITITYGFGVGLAAFAGVLAAPIYQVSPLMGADLIIVVFAVVVIGGMGSIMGSILTGFGLGVIEGLTRVFTRKPPAPSSSSSWSSSC